MNPLLLKHVCVGLFFIAMGQGSLAQNVSPPEPALFAEWGDDGAVELSWDAGGSEFVLEQTDAISDSIAWRTSSIEPVLQGDQLIVRIDPSEASQFFRLRQVAMDSAFRIREISPADGEEMVNPARNTVVRFDERVDPGSVPFGLPIDSFHPKV